MTNREKLELIPEKTKRKPISKYSKMEIELILELNFGSRVEVDVYRSLENSYLKSLKSIKSKYCK